jgi:hypothetical protein
MNDDVKNFLLSLLEEGGMGEVPEEVKDQMVQDLYVRLDDRLKVSILEAMTDEQRVELQKLIDEDKSDEDVQQYIIDNVKNLNDIYTKVFEEFKDLYLK